MVSFISRSPAETVAFARTVGEQLAPGAVLALCGDLGAGKTQFVKGLVEGLGSEAPVTSPTFALLHEYPEGRLAVYHFDFYRLANATEALRLGLDDYLGGDGVCVIEWADRFPELLPPDCDWFSFETVNEIERRIHRGRAA